MHPEQLRKIIDVARRKKVMIIADEVTLESSCCPLAEGFADLVLIS
jgi:bifunctional pyridoxal-dependent enzyme with beta-cystathionase and maltose regulon repressor activities